MPENDRDASTLKMLQRHLREAYFNARSRGAEQFFLPELLEVLFREQPDMGRPNGRRDSEFDVASSLLDLVTGYHREFLDLGEAPDRAAERHGIDPESIWETEIPEGLPAEVREGLERFDQAIGVMQRRIRRMLRELLREPILARKEGATLYVLPERQGARDF